MKLIGGNVIATIQVKSIYTNDIGEQVETWAYADSLKGFLDYVSGESSSQRFDKKLEQSTHIFMADWKQLPSSVTSGTACMMINGQRYNIMVIDDPMGLHQHYEIYLKLVGGQA